MFMVFKRCLPASDEPYEFFLPIDVYFSVPSSLSRPEQPHRRVVTSSKIILRSGSGMDKIHIHFPFALGVYLSTVCKCKFRVLL